MALLDSPDARERDLRTAEAFDDPQVGDRFHEMYSWWLYVVAVEPDGRVATLCATPPCTLPRDGKLAVYADAAAFRERYAYGTIPGYSPMLADRGNDVEGWFPGWPEPEPEPEPDPLQPEVDALAQVLYEAWEKGIRFGTATLARYILAAGYRRVSGPESVEGGGSDG